MFHAYEYAIFSRYRFTLPDQAEIIWKITWLGNPQMKWQGHVQFWIGTSQNYV